MTAPAPTPAAPTPAGPPERVNRCGQVTPPAAPRQRRRSYV